MNYYCNWRADLIKGLMLWYVNNKQDVILEPVAVNSTEKYDYLKRNGLLGVYHAYLASNNIYDVDLTTFSRDLTKEKLKIVSILSSLFDSFKEHKIKAVVLKGVTVPYYRTFYDRSAGDIDLLIDPKDQDQCHIIFTKFGFKLVKDEIEDLRANLASKGIGYEYLLPNSNLVIDLHFTLTDPLFGSYKDFSNPLSHIVEKNVGDITIPSLPPEIEYYYLCHHAVKHAFMKIIWLFDIALINENSKILNLPIDSSLIKEVALCERILDQIIKEPSNYTYSYSNAVINNSSVTNFKSYLQRHFFHIVTRATIVEVILYFFRKLFLINLCDIKDFNSYKIKHLKYHPMKIIFLLVRRVRYGW